MNKLINLIEKHGTEIFLTTVFAVAVFGIVCGFAGLLISVFSSDNQWLWFFLFVVPLLLFVLWAMFNAAKMADKIINM